MKKMLVFVLALLALQGCYYDKEELLYGSNAPCEAGSVTFSNTITGILTAAGCLNCHAGNSPSGNINLQGYANVKAVAANGRLLGAINHSPGFSPMPQGGNKMSACDIAKVK